MTKAAADAGVPLVYVNREPVNVDKLGPKAGLRRLERGRVRHARDQGDLQAAQAARATSWSSMGELSNQAAVQRTKDIHDVIATPECSGIKIIDEQTGELGSHQGRRT